jgi:D-alanine transaminase
MFRIAYVNGRYVPHDLAVVHVEDRGYQFADAIYEVCEIYGGAPLDEVRHMQRLERSLRELSIPLPLGLPALGVILREVVRRNRVAEGYVYIQVSRGVAPRDHPFPTTPVRPSLVVTAKSIGFDGRDARARKGVAVITAPDIRWGRVDIKTVGLLPNVLAKQGAREQGAYEAWLVDRDGNVTEGASTNAWIVNAKGTLVTRHADAAILRGVTRMVLLDVAAKRNVAFEERSFSVKEALAAREAFLTSATNGVMPIVQIDGKKIGSGKPGPVATALRAGLISAQADEVGAAKV